jgi:hypothetical protein
VPVRAQHDVDELRELWRVFNEENAHRSPYFFQLT